MKEKNRGTWLRKKTVNKTVKSLKGRRINWRKKWSNERMMENEYRRMKWRKAEGLIERNTGTKWKKRKQKCLKKKKKKEIMNWSRRTNPRVNKKYTGMEGIK